MSKEQTTAQQEAYQQLQSQHELKRPILKNCVKAFLVGGTFCLVGQAIILFLYLLF